MSTKNILIYFLCEGSQTIIPSVEVCSTFNMAFLKKMMSSYSINKEFGQNKFQQSNTQK